MRKILFFSSILVCTPLALAASCPVPPDAEFFRTATLPELGQCLGSSEEASFRDPVNGETLLHRAARWAKEPGVVPLLLMRGVSLDARRLDGYTALHVAASEGTNVSVLQELIDREQDLDDARVASGSCHHTLRDLLYTCGTAAMHLAAERIDGLPIVITLAAAGASLEPLNLNERTPLHLAAKSSNADVVEFLLKNGASIDPQDYEDYTPLHLSGTNPDPKQASAIARVLVENGASLSEKEGRESRSALMYLAYFSSDMDLIEFLYDNADKDERCASTDVGHSLYRALKGKLEGKEKPQFFWDLRDECGIEE